MCGIVGYIGFNQASDFLLDGMAKLEYRGYDSAGIAIIGAENVIKIQKGWPSLQFRDYRESRS